MKYEGDTLQFLQRIPTRSDMEKYNKQMDILAL